jgi:four helix bundle protein
MRDYKKIKAWQLADQLVFKVYETTQDFPREERYGLTSQLRCSVVSVPTNICEGASRQHKRDYLNFLYIARGSLMETEYLLSLALRFQFLRPERNQSISELLNQVQSKLYGLIRSVESEL